MLPATVRPQKIGILLLLLLIGYRGMSQAVELPKGFYAQNTTEQKVTFLYKCISDSALAGNYSNVPFFCHTALKLCQQLPNDTLSGMLYQFLGDANDEKNNDSAAFYYRRSLSVFKNIQLVKKLYLQQSLLYVFTALDKKDSILFYIHELEKSISALPDTNKSKLKAVNTIATSYGAVTQYENAIQSFRFVIKNALQIKDSLILRNALVNTGQAYNETGDNTMAVYYTLQAIPYVKDDLYARLVTYANLTDYYTALNNWDSAKIFMFKADTIVTNMGDEYAINALGIRKAILLTQEKKYTLAEAHLEKSLAYFKQLPPGLDLYNCLMAYAGLDTVQKKYARAKEHLLNLYEVTKAMNQKVRTAENLQMLAMVYELLGDYKEAYRYQKLFIAVKDSIKADKAAENFAQLQTEYQTYKKEEEINKLQKEQQIKNLELRTALKNKWLYIILSIVLLSAFLIILYIRNLRNKTTLQNVKTALEMKSLRSQMNPHFIFNSLNSIQKYIWENKQEDASEYLTKFARLIRLVLENSQHQSISLSEELITLRLYIEMEHRRNNQKFDYSITVSENIDADKFYCPPLILQPYVENAIWHGLSLKDSRGKLAITIEKNDAFLICIIDDNGVGRKYATQIRNNENKKSSLAMNISSQRIAWLQKDTGAMASVNIRDKYNGDEPEGTTVTIYLPLITKA